MNIMKSINLVVFIALIIEFGFAQNIKLHNKSISNGFEIFVDNNEHCPVSVKIDFKLRNLKSSVENNKIYVIPANTKNHKITVLEVIKNGKYGFNTNQIYNYGDEFLKSYDEDFIYDLPYDKGKSFKISQGYNGTFSHQSKNAIDFDMPVGTKVFAARSGTIIKVVDKNNKGCAQEKCKKYNNFCISVNTNND